MKKKRGPFCKGSTYAWIGLIVVAVSAAVRFLPELVRYIRGEAM